MSGCGCDLTTMTMGARGLFLMYISGSQTERNLLNKLADPPPVNFQSRPVLLPPS